MRRLISCDFFDFDSAERAMCAINRINCDGIQMSLNRKRYDGSDKKGIHLIPVVPTVGASTYPFPALATYADFGDGEERSENRAERCNLLVAFSNHRFADKIINTLRRHGAISLREIKY